MIKEERKRKILSILEEEEKVIATELSRRFSVSEDTIRRDLNELSAQGLLRRVHSGALRVGPPITNFSYRQNLDTDTKQKLAKKALHFLKENSVIIIDGGTTNLELVKLIPIDFTATIITNSPPIAITLANHKNLEVINLGGFFFQESMINVGVDTILSLNQMRADLYVMGLHNINAEVGASVPTLQEAQVKSKMVDISTEVIALVTPNKFGTISNYIVCPPEEISCIITDQLSNRIKEEYHSKNLEFID